MTREITNRNFEWDYGQRTRLFRISTTAYEQYTYDAGGQLVKRFSRSGSEFYSNLEIDGLFQYKNRLNIAAVVYHIVLIIVKFVKRGSMLTKEKIKQSLETLTDNLTVDQVIDRLIMLDKIEQGLDQVKLGYVYSTEEAKAKLSKWLK